MSLDTPLYVEITKMGANPARIGRASGNPIKHGENTLAVFKLDLEIDDRFFEDGAVNSGLKISLTDPGLPASVVREGLKEIDADMQKLQ